ncbi:MAG: pitrilysin family protein [Planctomycetota bacterium]
MASVHTERLESGVVLLVQDMPSVRSAAVSLTVPAGLASEPEEHLGAASVMSEVLMRGAGARGSRDLADAFDLAGCTRAISPDARVMSLRGTTIGDRLSEALTLFASVVLEPRITRETLEPSKSLSTQALESLSDDPRERASIALRGRHMPAPYNRSIYGSKDGIESLTVDGISKWWRGRAVPEGTVIGVAGVVDPAEVAERVNAALSGWQGSAGDLEPTAQAQRGPGHIDDDSNQVQVLAMFDAPNERDEHAAIREKLAASVLSGGMSGRLFTEVREKRGLCYAVSAGYRGDDRFGAVSAYVGTTPERAQESLDVLTAELRRIRTPDGAVTADEFERARTGMRANIVFHGESTAARSSALVADFRKLGRARTLDEMTAAIDAVTLDSLNEYLASTPLGAATLQTLGPKELTPPAGY